MAPSAHAPAAPVSSGDEIRALLERGEKDAAVQAARTLLAEQPGMRTWRVLRRMAESDAAARAGLKPYGLALLSSFTTDFLHDALIAHGLVNGLALRVYQAPYGAFRQEALDPDSGLYRARPDAVILAVEGEDWVPDAYRPDRARDAAAWPRARDGFRDEFERLVGALRSRTAAPLLVHNFVAPAWRALGILDAMHPDGQAWRVRELNDEMLACAVRARDVHIVDYAALAGQHGILDCRDDRMRLYARAPIAQRLLGPLAREYMKFVRCFTGSNRKCLVLDLDNTLWGGVVGEEGVEGIELGPTYPGSAYVEFQQHVLALHRRGVLLAIASRNNPADVEAVFARHRHMVLAREHFAAVEIHWERKSESLRRISAALGIGLEHIVLADDNPAECEEVRVALPMVTTVQLPREPERYVAALHEAGWFDALAVSEEDLRRTELYRQRAEAEALRPASGAVEDYYRALNMELRVLPIDEASLKRAAQLTQKTNQLNATTRRYTEAALAAVARDAGWVALAFGVTDRFGDNGTVGVALAREEGDALRIDTFLLSCRVIGRGVEAAMLACLSDVAAERGLDAVVGEVLVTPKNVPVRDVYARNGFEKMSEDALGNTLWRLDVRRGGVAWPDWFRVTREAGRPREEAH
jgi:FkbH-like protein